MNKATFKKGEAAMIFFILLVIVVIVLAVAYIKTADRGYTIGKGMFKNSEHCLDEKEEDICEHDYWSEDKYK